MVYKTIFIKYELRRLILQLTYHWWHDKLERFCSRQVAARIPITMWADRRKPQIWCAPEWLFRFASKVEFFTRK
jgi:hypothetical protein